MPFKYKIFQQQKTIVVQAIGIIDLHSSSQTMKDVVADREFHPQYSVIVDLRKMKYNPSTPEMFRMRDSLASHIKHFKGEITIVTSKEALYIAKLFCMLAKVYHFKVTPVTHLKGLEAFEHKLV